MYFLYITKPTYNFIKSIFSVKKMGRKKKPIFLVNVSYYTRSENIRIFS